MQVSSVVEIKKAVSSLSAKDLSRFRDWLDEYDAKAWDKQLERDAKSGRLARRGNHAVADSRAGRFKERFLYAEPQ